MRIRTLTHIHSIVYNNLYVHYVFFFDFFFLQLISANKIKGAHSGSKEECTQITNLCEQKIKKNALP